MADGFPVVLSADRILTAGHPLLLEGMAAATQTTATPRWMFDPLLAPAGGTIDGVRARCAPLGLRRIEAALLADGFDPAGVAVVDEDHLQDAIGPATRVVGLATGDPAGRAMNSTTMAAIMGGTPWPAAGFQRLLAAVRRLVAGRAPQAVVAVGGPGVWQLDGVLPAGIDTVVHGYCEAGIAVQMRSWMAGARPPARVDGSAPASASAIPAIRGATTMGAIEIGRGCGWGCSYCTLARPPLIHLAPEQVVADAACNLAAGQRHLALLSEDCLRYGGQGARPDPAAFLALLARLRALPDAGLLQVDHANLASVARWSDAELAEAARLLAGGLVGRPWINVGVESADGALVARHGAAKLGGCPPDAWAAHSATQIRRLVDAGWFPFVSLVLGLPGESPDGLAATRRWVEALRGLPCGVFPLFHAPLAGTASPPAPEHWDLLAGCWRDAFRRLPALYRDHQRAAGVPWTRRSLIGLLGRGNALWWETLFWRRRRAALRRSGQGL